MGARRGYLTTIASVFLALVSVSCSGLAHAGVFGGSLENTGPVISGAPPTSVRVGQPFAFAPTAYDPDSERLRFKVSGLPSWASFDKRTGRMSGTPGATDVGSCGPIAIGVYDSRETAWLPSFTITVTAPAAPWISGTPPTSGREKELYGFLPSAGDADGDPLTFSIANKPAWATFTSSSGLLSGIPPLGAAGTYSNIVISVSDGQSTRSLPAFSIDVAQAPNTAPTISGIPATSVSAGSPYSFKPAASDPDGQPLEFSIRNLPAWASFETRTGALAGTPSDGEVGTFSNIVINVSDGITSTSLAAFSVTVVATNSTPVIGGTPPPEATVGQLYAFTPTATDKDGQTLSFAISGRPPWASFDTATGKLSGTPTSSAIGTTSGIVISVSDGRASSSLGPFSITVASGTPGSATLSWVPPTENVDGTPVTNLAGYRIAYGQSAASLTLSVDVPDPAITTATIENLARGTWYFAVKAYTTAAVESDLSNLAQKTVN